MRAVSAKVRRRKVEERHVEELLSSCGVTLFSSSLEITCPHAELVSSPEPEPLPYPSISSSSSDADGRDLAASEKL